MDAFWKWFMRANARGVSAGLLLALLGTSGFWVWKLRQQIRESRPGATQPTRASLRGDLGLLAFLDEQAALPFPQVKGSPFGPNVNYVPPVDPPVGVPPDTNQVMVTVAPPDGAPPAVRPKVERTPPPPRPPKPPPLSLTYKGIFQGTDGKVKALIEDSKSKRAAFYKAGDSVCGLRVGSIEKLTLDVETPDGASARLTVGESKTFEEGATHGP
jgi:hypothetical protein